MSWVVSLGAGKEQIPLIDAIHAEGYKCLAFDRDAHAPGYEYADHFGHVSNRDVNGILSFLSGESLDLSGVIAAGSEVPDVVAILAHRLGLPGVSVATGMLIKDKLRYKEVLSEARIPHTGVVDEAKGRAVVVKPRVSSGSRGVELYSPGSIPLVPHRDTHMMEVFQPGPQISSETLIWDGGAYTAAFADRLYDHFAHEIGVAMPSVWMSEYEACHTLAVNAAKALGIQRGTIKCDLVLTEDGPKIIELTCRLSGGPLCELVEKSCGVNYFRQAVRLAVGKDVTWEDGLDRAEPRCWNKVAIGMHGYEGTMTWEESRKYIVKELGKCSR